MGLARLRKFFGYGVELNETKIASHAVDVHRIGRRLYLKFRGEARRHQRRGSGPFQFRHHGFHFDSTLYKHSVAIKWNKKVHLYSWHTDDGDDVPDGGLTITEEETICTTTTETVFTAVVRQISEQTLPVAEAESWALRELDSVLKRKSPKKSPVSISIGPSANSLLGVAATDDGAYAAVYDANEAKDESKFHVFVDVAKGTDIGLAIVIMSAKYRDVFLTINSNSTDSDRPCSFVRVVGRSLESPVDCYFRLYAGKEEQYGRMTVLQDARLYWDGRQNSGPVSVEGSQLVTMSIVPPSN